MPDTGFKSPSANGLVNAQFNNPTNAYASDDVYATEGTSGRQHDFYNYSFDLPSNASIAGIEIAVEAKASGLTDDTQVTISYDGGSTYTSAITVSHETTESTQTAGGSNNLWGRTWAVSEFADGTFIVNLEKNSAGTTSYDHIQVKVYYSIPAHVTVGTGGHRTKIVKTDYPHEEGLTLGTTKLKDSAYSDPEEGSLVDRKDKVGL